MTDYLGLNVSTLGKTFRTQASGMRLLADEILDGEFRRGLLVLARPVLDLAVNFRIDGSATTEMHRDRETKCREEVRSAAER